VSEALSKTLLYAENVTVNIGKIERMILEEEEKKPTPYPHRTKKNCLQE